VYSKYDKNIKKVRILDSLKKLPFSVKEIAKAFDLPIQKGEIDYDAVREIEHVVTCDEKSYILGDGFIVAKALEKQFSEGLDKMTIGSDALTQFKIGLANSEIKKVYEKVFRRHFPLLNKKTDAYVRNAYRGGYVYVKKELRGVDVAEGLSYDVNSLFPSVMKKMLMPYGSPVFYVGEYEKNVEYPLFIARINVEFEIKEGFLPCIQLKNNLLYRSTEYLEKSEGEVELFVSSVDLELIKNHYNCRIEYVDGYMFKGVYGIFDAYIKKWMNVKENNTGARRQIAKLMLNSLYGKFGSNPDVTGKIPYLENDVVKYRLSEYKEKDTVYTPLGVFITSYARYKTISTAQKFYDRFAYCDTDSIHLLGLEVPDIEIHRTKLGAWKHEYDFKRARYIRAKTYVEELEDESLVVKCAGMTDDIKSRVTFDNFKVGFKDIRLRKKSVKGGVKLIKSPFEIKNS